MSEHGLGSALGGDDDGSTEAPFAPFTPPASPCYNFLDDLPAIPTDEFGMIAGDYESSDVKKKIYPRKQDVKIIRRERGPRQYVSRHFAQSKPVMVKTSKRKRKAVASGLEDFGDVKPEATVFLSTPASACPQTSIKDSSTLRSVPRVYYGLDVDDLSSDSDLTDVPDDIGPDPFLSPSTSASTHKTKLKGKSRNTGRQPNGEDATSTPPAKAKPQIRRKATTSPYFPEPKHAHRPHFLATLPFPPLSNPTFGLMQERLAHSPYRLLLATIFLNKTPGSRAMPVFYDLMTRYPTPLDLSNAQIEDVTAMIRHLGFQNQRARKCIAMAQGWVERPPVLGKRYRKLGYPVKGDGKDIKEGETVDAEDARVAWEISHLPGLGPYSHDSWRMFCRDELRGLATDWLGKGADQHDFEPEWKRVLPADKELRAWMTWMWLKEGWLWNKETGEKTKASDELLELAKHGGVVQEPVENDHLVVKRLEGDVVMNGGLSVEKPAGDFIPS